MAAMQGETIETTSNAADAIDRRCQRLSSCRVDKPELLRRAIQFWRAVELVKSGSSTDQRDGFWPKRRWQDIVLFVKYCRQTPGFAGSEGTLLLTEYIIQGRGELYAPTGDSEEVLIRKDIQFKRKERLIRDASPSITVFEKAIHQRKGAG
jgi:hypothetical protein